MKKLWQIVYVRHITYWITAYLFVVFSVLIYDNLLLGIKIATMVVLPAPFTVYSHFLVLKLFFNRRKYLLYGISVAVIVIITGFIVEFIFQIFFASPGSHTAGFLSALFYIISSTGLKYYSEGIQNQRRIQEIEFKQLQTEMQLLKSQINPHFFFNTLNNLYALSLEKADEVPDVILKISDLMRYVLDSNKKKSVRLSDEIEFIKNYTELERLRFEKKAKINLNMEGNIDSIEIPPMLFIPFIENSFKHGMKASVNGGFVSILFQVEDEYLNFTISNNKPASEKKPDDSTQMGLENIRRRLNLLYDGKYKLVIKEENEEYHTVLKIRI